MRHWRPSTKVKAHKPERSFLGLAAERSFSCADAERSSIRVAAERPTERFVGMEVS